MRTLLEVIQFEIRYQLRSPFFLGALLLFAVIHFMAFTASSTLTSALWSRSAAHIAVAPGALLKEWHQGERRYFQYKAAEPMQMQGRWLLTENMADYSTLMLFKERYSPAYANRIVRRMLEAYLKGRRNEDEAEVPVMYTENHGYLRAKGPTRCMPCRTLSAKTRFIRHCAIF